MHRFLRIGTLLLTAPLATGCGDDGGSTTPPTASPPPLEQYLPASEDGPYPTGIVLTTFVDDTRPELATADTTDKRTLPTVIWYPAADAAREQPKAALGDALLPAVRTTLGALAAPGYLDAASNSVLNADVADGGPFPLLVFSHGNTGIGAQSYFLT